jgi:hypothetical protein
MPDLPTLERKLRGVSHPSALRCHSLAVHGGKSDAAQTLGIAFASLGGFNYPLSDYLADEV